MLPPDLATFVEESASLDKLTRTMLLLDYADRLGTYPDDAKDERHRVRGCTSLVYLHADYDADVDAMRYHGFADAQIVKGMVALLVRGLDGLPPRQIVELDPSFLKESGLTEALTATRQGGLFNILRRMQAEAEAHTRATSD
ncbi:MAG: SufE family protein [Bacteroidota bacterium]